MLTLLRHHLQHRARSARRGEPEEPVRFDESECENQRIRHQGRDPYPYQPCDVG